MAAVMRVRIQDIARKLIRASISNPRYIQNSVIMGFHRSSFLNVKGQIVKMPSLSPTMTEGTIVKWLKKEGDVINAGDVLCDIQTDKAVVSLEMEDDGILAKILVPENTPDVKVGTLIALTVNEGEDWKSVEMPDIPAVAAAAAAAAAAPPPPASAPAGAAAGAPAHQGSAALPIPILGASFATAMLKSYGPAVKYLLMKYDVNPDSIKPTGHRSKLLKADVLKYILDNKVPERKMEKVPPPSKAISPEAAKPAAAAKGAAKPRGKKAGYVDIEVSTMRKTIAKRLLESKQRIPHSYSTMVCGIDKLLQFRKKLKQDGVGVSVNDFVIKAVAHALVQCPEVNAVYQQDKLVLLPKVDISVAVATDAGLITPIVKDVVRKGLVEISAEVRNLAIKAREGKLQPHEFQGGSFTISNLGMFGVKEFSAIINPPQVAILAVGAAQDNINEERKIVKNMIVTLSFDRRAFDDATAAEFLQLFRSMIEDPVLIVLGRQPEKRINQEG